MTDSERYEAALHAMQTGVKVELAAGSTSGTPKHLRVGVNSALCDNTALVKLLVAKGLLTMEEFLKALADEMELEVGRYEEIIRERTGKVVKLH